MCCLLWFLVPCAPTFILRKKAREKYDIRGDTTDDVIASFICTGCADCQTAAEIKHRGDNGVSMAGGWKAQKLFISVK